VSDVTFDKLAQLIADVAARHGFDINDDTVLTHQELWSRYRKSYPTACPGDLQRRKGELIRLARQYRQGAAPAWGGKGETSFDSEEDDMAYIANVKNGNFYLVTGTKAHKLGAASNARRSGVPILDYPDDWAVQQLKSVVSGID